MNTYSHWAVSTLAAFALLDLTGCSGMSQQEGGASA